MTAVQSLFRLHDRQCNVYCDLMTASPVSNGSGMMKDPGIMKIVYVGRLNTGKNLEKWVDVAVDLHRRLNRTTFEIYGTGPLSQALTDKIRSLEAEDYITLPGYRSDIENVFREADLLLFLSEYEIFRQCGGRKHSLRYPGDRIGYPLNEGDIS